MALPVSLSGLSTSVATVGPFQLAAGTYYTAQITENSSTGTLTSAWSWMGQTINHGSGFSASRIRFRLHSSAGMTGTAVAEIRTWPGNVTLGTSASLDLSTLPTSAPARADPSTWQAFDFASPVSISASTDYLLVLKLNAGFTGSISTASGATGYASGARQTSANGTSWTAQADDMHFTLESAITLSDPNYYFLGVDSTNNYALDVYKATDPTSSWSQVTTVSTTSNLAISDIAAYQVGDNLHIALAITNSTNTDYRYYVYSLATESFTTSNEAIQTAIATNSFRDCSIVVRSSGDVIVIYSGAAESIMGTAYSRVRYARRVSGVWTTAVFVDAQGSVSWVQPECCLGASDRSHLFWSENAASTVYHRTLTSGNVLQTQGSVASIARWPRQAVSYQDGSDVRVALSGYAGASGAGIVYFISADTPTLNSSTVNAASSSVSQDISVRIFVDG
jgi:hypothetical protein